MAAGLITSFFDEAAVMQRALDLARLGQGHVEPNPCVGAVVVDSQLRCLGEGYHERFGGPHAEVNALRNAGESARGATLFVTLAPCHHHGKTPPCTAAVVAAGISRVVIAAADPADHGSGDGIEWLRKSGLQVETGLCSASALELLAPFATLWQLGRPYVHAKWAMSLDGKMATRSGHSQWITNEAARSAGHRLRSRMDAILTGIGTVLADNPRLTARPAGPRIATRIVLDSHARLPLDSQLVQSLDEAPVLVVTTSHAPKERCRSLEQAGVEVLIRDAEENRPACDLPSLLKELGQRRLTNLLLEAGSQVLGAFHDQSLIDEVHCFIAPKLIGGEMAPSPLGGTGHSQVPAESSLVGLQHEVLEDNLYLHGPLRKGSEPTSIVAPLPSPPRET